MPPFNFKKLTPHLLIIVGFAVFSLLFCYPALQGMVLNQHDIVSWKGMARETMAYHDSTGINPLWTNSMFGGMPTYTIAIPESHNYVWYIQEFFTTLLVRPADFLFLAMLCFYILMMVMRVDRWVGAIGTIAYAFATYNVVIINAGHETKMLAIAYMPAVFAGLILIYRNRYLGGGALLGAALALMVSTNHFQVLYYALIMFVFYVVGRFIIVLREKQPIGKFFVASGVALLVAVVGLGPSMHSILTTQEYAKYTMRGGQSELTINHNTDKKAGGLDKDYAFAWSNGIGETFCILIPYLYGGSSSEPIEKAPETEALVGSQVPSLPMYWGPQSFLSGPVYFGAIICFLFVLSLLVVRSAHKWWIVAVCLLTIMMSWGNNFKALNYALFDFLPMYNKFRTPTMILVIPQLLFPMLGIWGLMDILRGKTSGAELEKKIKIAGGITAGICLLFAFAGGVFFEFTNKSGDAQIPQQIVSALIEDRKALATKSALTSAVYIILAAGLLWAFAKAKLGKNILIGGLGLLITIDLVSVASNYLNESNFQDPMEYESTFQPRPVDQQILRDPDPYYRVLDITKNTYNDAVQAYFHKSIGGYSPAKLEIYQDLIDIHMGGAHSNSRFNGQVLNMLNTKYVIFGQPGQEAYQPNPETNGNAWFVDEVKLVGTADEEIMALNAPALGDTATMTNAFDSKKTAIVRNTFQNALEGFQGGKDSAANIRLTRYGLNDLSFVSNNSREGLAVFADIWYPKGWEAYVDGKQTPIIRANYVLRAIRVPAGQHNIEFHFRPQSFQIGNTIALITSILVFALIAAGIVTVVKKMKKDEPVAPTTDETYL